jgi:hypothetical protein
MDAPNWGWCHTCQNGEVSTFPFLVFMNHEQLYKHLQYELSVLGPTGRLIRSGQVENCFLVALDCWHELRGRLLRHSFENEAEEIEFFKMIKPRFTSEIEYYGLICQSLLFQPEPNRQDEVRAFWTRERGRLEKLVSSNKSFFDYYLSGCTELDHQYFLRDCYKTAPVDLSCFYVDDESTSCGFDHLVASLLAQQRFNSFVIENLEGCQ